MPGFVITEVRKGDELWAEATGQPDLRLFPESETVLFMDAIDAQLESHFDELGNATGFLFTQGGQAMEAKKLRDPS